jgi:hypothetical protein
MTAAAFRRLGATIAHLRDVLLDHAYESLAWKGKTMTTAAIAAHAYDQIDQVRTKLEVISKYTSCESLESLFRLPAFTWACVTFCAGVPRGHAFGRRDVFVHRY